MKGEYKTDEFGELKAERLPRRRPLRPIQHEASGLRLVVGLAVLAGLVGYLLSLLR